MNSSTLTVKRLHGGLVSHGFYPLAMSSVLALTFLAVRMSYFGSPAFRFLIWNLFLAWIPFALSFWISQMHQSAPTRRWRLVIPAAAWLAFFPNAPYILTDLMHLRPGQYGWWYDLGMILMFAWAGMFLGVTSLRAMHDVVRDICGAVFGWFFVLATVMLSGLGVYLGRFRRWNSWDILTQPHGLVADVLSRFTQLQDHPRTIGVTLMFGSILLMCYVTLRMISLPRHDAR